MSAILCKDLRKYYKDGDVETKALQGFSCEIQEGELVILTGPASSGKSTLLSVLGGMTKPDSGECTLLGQDLFSLTEAKRSEFRLKHIGIHFQNFCLSDALSVFENLLAPLDFSGWSYSVAKNRVEDMLEQMGLRKKSGCIPSKLSQGERQLTAIGRALIADPKILLLDEPCLHLDHQTAVLVMTLLRQLVLDHGIIVVASINDVRLHPFASRLFRMKEGKLASIQGEGIVDETPPPFLRI